MSAPEPTPADVAIAALTAAARPVDPATGVVGEADMGEILCRVITSVAANVDGVDQLLAGRPGSWEAALIRQVVDSTAGPDLAAYRTVPFVLQVDPGMLFAEWGYDQMYDEAAGELMSRGDAVDTDADGVVTEAGEAQLAIVGAAEIALETLHQADLDTLVASFAAAAETAAIERGLRVPVVVQRVEVDAGPPPWGELVEDLYTAGLDGALLPGGRTLADYGGHRPADVDRAAGRTYLTRLAEGELQ